MRALTRVAGRENEDALLEFALRTTAARVEERCRELRCCTADSTDEALRAHARRTLSLRRDPERGTVTITVELPMEQAELIDKAPDRAVETASATSDRYQVVVHVDEATLRGGIACVRAIRGGVSGGTDLRGGILARMSIPVPPVRLR